MSKLPPVSWLLVLPALVALSAGAQSTSAPPIQQAASAPPAAPLKFRSALDTYKPYTDDPVLPWKETNTQVRNAGGWRAYAKEASEPDAGDNKAPATTPNPHAGHGKP